MQLVPRRHREPHSGVVIQSRTERPSFVTLDCHGAYRASQ